MLHWMQFLIYFFLLTKQQFKFLNFFLYLLMLINLILMYKCIFNINNILNITKNNFFILF